ncbi:MAG: DUF1738 domain-containing protein [Bacteroidales bacterium]|nr:DUF1738 domain-containing protein [Candidatus Cacconaster merdequi]
MADNTSTTSSIDSHVKAYADLFIAKFDSIAGDWRQPWLPTLPFSSQNAAGHLYSGVNDVNLSLLCALKGYGVPVWLTPSQCRDLNVLRLKGEQGMSVYWGGTSFFDKQKGVLDTQMRWADYQKMTPLEKERYSLRENFGNVTYVWNLEQTDFPQKYPDTWENLKSAFTRNSSQMSESTLDSFLEDGGWYPDDCHRCQIILTEDSSPRYDRHLRCIEVPSKEHFSDTREFYNTLLHTMAHSAIIELSFANAKGSMDPLSDMARLNLASELAAAVIAGRLGLSQTLTQSNLQYLKQWTQILSDDPSVIRQVTRESRYAVQLMSDCMHLREKEAPDVCSTLGEQIRQAQEKRQAAGQGHVPANRSTHMETNQRTGKPQIRKGRSAHI